MWSDPVDAKIKKCLRELWQKVEKRVAAEMARPDLRWEKGITYNIAEWLESVGERQLNVCLAGYASAKVRTWRIEWSSSDESETGADLGVAISIRKANGTAKAKATFFQAKRLQEQNGSWVIPLDEKDSKGLCRARKQAEALAGNYPRRASAFLIYGPASFGTRVMSSARASSLAGSAVTDDEGMQVTQSVTEFFTEVYDCTKGSKDKRHIDQVQRRSRGKRVRGRRRVSSAISIEINATSNNEHAASRSTTDDTTCQKGEPPRG